MRSQYPDEHRRYALRVIGRRIAVLAAVAIVGVALTIRAPISEVAGLGAVIAWGVAGYFAIASLVVVADALRVAVVPYFKEPVPQVSLRSTLSGGVAIARNAKALDRIATAIGVNPPCSFGYRDDLLGEAIDWFDPAAGVESFSSLVEAIAEVPDLDDHTEMVLKNELESILRRLEKATELGIPFCLVLYHGSSASPVEMSRRIGHF